jgi:hypothetical protein
MRRISHDLAGVAQRLSHLSDQFGMDASEVAEVWQDAKGRAYLQQHASEIQPTTNQLVNTIQGLIELFEDIAKKLRDPQQGL